MLNQLLAKLSYEDFSPAMLSDTARPTQILTLTDLYPYINTLYSVKPLVEEGQQRIPIDLNK